MTVASIAEIKQELLQLSKEQLIAHCLRLARYKQENKALLNYVLFKAHDSDAYIIEAKAEIDIAFSSINTSNVYFTKKSLRKILRQISKYGKYSGSSFVEAELLIHFCELMKALPFDIHKHQVLFNIYQSQYKKIEKLIASLHEDLQFEFNKRIESLLV